MVKIKIFEFIGPSGAGKTTLLDNILKKDILNYEREEYSGLPHQRVNNWLKLPEFILFCILNLRFVYIIWKYSSKNCFYINFTRLFPHYFRTKKAIFKASSNKQVMFQCDSLIHTLIGCFMENTFKSKTKIITYLNTFYFSQNQVICINLLSGVNQVTKNRIMRNHSQDYYTKKDILNQTRDYISISQEILKKIKYHRVITVNYNIPPEKIRSDILKILR